MKTLYISSTDFTKTNGGALCSRELYHGLKASLQSDLFVYSPTNVENNIIHTTKSRISDTLSRVYGHSSYFYNEWRKNRKLIFERDFELIFLSNSRLGFIARDIKKYNTACKIVTYFQNVEYDYCSHVSFHRNETLSKAIMNIERRLVYKDEKDALLYSDFALFLTERDEKRAVNLYNIEKNSALLPICLEKKVVKQAESGEYNLIFLGSLWYKPNVQGIIWFINNVWNRIYKKYKLVKLIIAGSNPVEELKKFNGQSNIYIISNFNTLDNIITDKSVCIAPIFEGAGMKVKVCESLSLGIPIIATNEALVGYEEGMNDNDNISIYRANNSDEFVASIVTLLSGDSHLIGENSTYLFNKYYSMSRVDKTINEILRVI